MRPGELVLVKKHILPHYGEPYNEKDEYVYGIVLEQPFIERNPDGPYSQWEYKRIRILMDGVIRTVSFHQVKKLEETS